MLAVAAAGGRRTIRSNGLLRTTAAAAAARRKIMRPSPRMQRRHTATADMMMLKPLEMTWKQFIQSQLVARPIEYATIPCVAAFVGIMTNWMGVKMLFFPIEYMGVDVWPRPRNSPLGYFGWQGVVPTKTEPMASRLVDIVTSRLLSLEEAFARLDPHELATLLWPALEISIRRDCGDAWWHMLRPVLPILLPHVLHHLQRDINDVLNLRQVVMTAFVRDKEVLVDLFQKVGRVELEFLVNSGFGFGFLLGLLQMGVWAAKPKPWTLPVAGALVGYITNWIAIKLLFEPAEPVNLRVCTVQGLFESRQMEVSDEFGAFMEHRVLSPEDLLKDMAEGGAEGDLYAFLRRELPFPVPHHVIVAAVTAIHDAAQQPQKYRELHAYVKQKLDIEYTLSSRLKLLSPSDFENLLHPVFQEDEIILIVTGGVLGAVAGLLQTRLGWGGPKATVRAIATITSVLGMSAAFYVFQKYESRNDDIDPPVSAKTRPHLRRRVTVVKVNKEYDIFGREE